MKVHPGMLMKTKHRLAEHRSENQLFSRKCPNREPFESSRSGFWPRMQRWCGYRHEVGSMLRATGILPLKGCGGDGHHKIAKSRNDPMARWLNGPIRQCPNLNATPPSWRLQCRLEAGVTPQNRAVPRSRCLVNSGGGLYNKQGRSVTGKAIYTLWEIIYSSR